MSLFFYWILSNLFHRVYEQFILRVERCNFLLYTGSWIPTSFLPSKNYTAIMEGENSLYNSQFQMNPKFR